MRNRPGTLSVESFNKSDRALLMSRSEVWHISMSTMQKIEKILQILASWRNQCTK